MEPPWSREGSSELLEAEAMGPAFILTGCGLSWEGHELANISQQSQGWGRQGYGGGLAVALSPCHWGS